MTATFISGKDVTTRIFHDVTSDSSEALRARYLDEARALAKAL